MSEMKVDLGGGRERTMKVNYPSNSRSGKVKAEAEAQEKNQTEARERPEPVVTGNVVRRKRSLGGKVLQTFIVEDSESIIGYIVAQVLVPAAKNMIYDAFSQGVQRALFGGDSRPSSSVGARSGYTSYSKVSAQPRKPLTPQERAKHDFSDLIIGSRGEAEDVLDSLRNLVNQFQFASVQDLYDLVGLTGDFTDNKWGWDDLRSASIRLVHGGYLIDLPRTQPLT